DTAASVGFSFQDQTSTDGYAIPIAHALSIAKKIEAKQATGTTHIGATAMMGVSVAPTSSFGFGGPFDAGSTSGAIINGGVPRSPAASTGIQAGDVITSLGGRTIASSTALSNVILKSAPGATV